MAFARVLEDSDDELTCPLCYEYFERPVQIECSHNFCRECITPYWEESDKYYICPRFDCNHRCHFERLWHNWPLRDKVEKKKGNTKLMPRDMCMKHEEELKFFCEEDQRIICETCRASKEHKSHSVSPIGEAAQRYKVKLRDSLSTLKKELERIEKTSRQEEEVNKPMKKNVESKNPEIGCEIEQLRQLLKAKEAALQQKLEKDEAILMGGRANVVQIDARMSALNMTITEIKEKCDRPDLELLKDVKGTLKRYNDVKLNREKKENISKSKLRN